MGPTVNVAVALARGILHEPGISRPEHVGLSIAGGDLGLAAQVDDEPPIGERVEIHGARLGPPLNPDLAHVQHRVQLRVFFQLHLFHVALTVAGGVDSKYRHRVPRWCGVPQFPPIVGTIG